MNEETNVKKSNQKPKKHGFQYVGKAYRQLRSWVETASDLEEFGNLEYFCGFVCPVSTARVNVMERAISDYDIIQLTILKMFDAGVTGVKQISEIMGLTEEMVSAIVNILKNTYHHIEDDKITDEGRESLEKEMKVEVYETSKQIQFEALSGIILSPDLFQGENESENAYYDQMIPDQTKIFLPKRSIERNIQQELTNHLDKYQDKGSVSRNVEDILALDIEKVGYTEAFLVKYDFLPHPFIIFPVRKNKNIQWKPVAISTKSEKIMLRNELAFKTKNRDDYDALVMDNSVFEAYKEIEAAYGLEKKTGEVSPTFTRQERTFKVVEKGTEGAVIDLHPDAPYTPVYVVDITDTKEEP